MGLRTKLLLYILTTSLIIFTVGIGYISIRYKTKALDNAKQVADAYVREYSNLIKYSMDKDFGVCRGMTQAFIDYEGVTIKTREKIHNKILKNVLDKNNNFIAVFLQWEYKTVDTNYHKEHGRLRYIYYRKKPKIFQKIKTEIDFDEEITYLQGIVDTLDYNKQNPYYTVKKNLNEYIINPYFYSYDDVSNMPENSKVSDDAVLETTLIIPIFKDKKFVGIAGCDIPLNHFQEILKKIQPFKESYTFLLGNNGKFVTNPDENKLITSIYDVFTEESKKYNILEKIKSGKTFSFSSFLKSSDTETYVTFAPVHIANTVTPWSVGIVVPVNVIMQEANRHFYISIMVGIIGLILLSALIWIVSKNITDPILNITTVLQKLAKGRINKVKRIEVKTKDEIGAISKSTNILIEGFYETVEFAHQIGKGNLGAKYNLLSKDDILGKALIEMRKNLKLSKEEIEDKTKTLIQTNNDLINKNVEINLQKEEIQSIADNLEIANTSISEKKQIIEEILRETTDSINYASRIQKAMLPSKNLLSKYFNDYFVFYRPKEIVSGDFYWVSKIKNYIVFAAADCTGHGVSGAFVSLLGISFLNEIVRQSEVRHANQILEVLRKQIKTTLRQSTEYGASKDGMDIALALIDTETNIMQYAGAYNPLYILRNTENNNEETVLTGNVKLKIHTRSGKTNKHTKLIEIKADRQPVAVYSKEKPFENHEIRLFKNDIIYLFSDGYVDQFHKRTGEKFKNKRFRDLFFLFAGKSMSEQLEIFENTFDAWKGDSPQIDDVVIFGLKI